MAAALMADGKTRAGVAISETAIRAAAISAAAR
jgi:hypothetical protein